MVLTIPPGGVLLSVAGLRGVADRDAVVAALRQRDPACHVQADWPRGLVVVQSDHPPQVLRMAVQDAGFITAWLTHPPREIGVRGVVAILMGVIGLGFAGLVLGTLAGGIAGLAILALSTDCGPGDSGGCAMGIPVMAFGAGCIGAVAGAGMALLRAARRQRGRVTRPNGSV